MKAKKRQYAVLSKWLILLGALLVLWLLWPKGEPQLLDAATSSFALPNATEAHWLSENELLTFRNGFSALPAVRGIPALPRIIRGRGWVPQPVLPSAVWQIHDMGRMNIASGRSIPLPVLKRCLTGLQGNATLVNERTVPGSHLVLISTTPPIPMSRTFGMRPSPSVTSYLVTLDGKLVDKMSYAMGTAILWKPDGSEALCVEQKYTALPGATRSPFHGPLKREITVSVYRPGFKHNITYFRHPEVLASETPVAYTSKGTLLTVQVDRDFAASKQGGSYPLAMTVYERTPAHLDVRRSQVSHASDLSTDRYQQWYPARISPDGNRVLWRAFDGRSGAVGSDLLEHVSSLLHGHIINSSGLRWQPAYSGPAVSVWVSRVDGSGMRELGRCPTAIGGGLSISSLDWRPDGKSISFLYNGRLYIVPVK